MKRGRSTGKPTKAQVRRFEQIKDIGCIACRKQGYWFVECDCHHLNIGGKHGQKRRGHDFTIGLCEFHHRGTASEGVLAAKKLGLGPSFALQPREFRTVFGTDDELLEYQNKLIAEMNL